MTDESSEGTRVNLTALDHIILDFLHEGARNQAYMVDNATFPRHRYRRRLELLEMTNYVERLHDQTALYELREDDRPEDVIGEHLAKVRAGDHPALEDDGDQDTDTEDTGTDETEE